VDVQLGKMQEVTAHSTKYSFPGVTFFILTPQQGFWAPPVFSEALIEWLANCSGMARGQQVNRERPASQPEQNNPVVEGKEGTDGQGRGGS
jgi:hypothetical protein